jgi:hypothetical protein
MVINDSIFTGGDITMKKIKCISLIIIGFLLGLCLAAIILKYQYVKNIIKSISWEYIIPILSLFAGALIPIYITYKTINGQEIVKLKSELVKTNLDIIDRFKTQTFLLRTNVIYDKTIKDMITRFEIDEIDKKSLKLRCPYILNSLENLSNFNMNYQLLSEGVRRFRNNKIDEYINYMSTYVLNLMITVDKISEVNLWELSLIVKADLVSISNEVEELLNDYIDNKLFKLDLKKGNNKRGTNLIELEKRMNSTNLFKYKSEIIKLYK